MRSEISGVATFIKKQQPLAGYTHCRGHAINLVKTNQFKRSWII